ncbi:MAG: sigma factor-like helix-turn-helix DNA-binding protein [Candidatus Taylorbacteria bacterium]|nr:sigma factor-like helix-turn-helix DNA-binding protein [Candidatus Taylorbacteria bacterium]
MSNTNSAITKTVVLLVKNLSTRNRDIISRRFGLKTGKKETLESIGKSYGITRERVRQIEEFSLKQLSKMTPTIPDIVRYVSLSKDILGGNGGVMRESDMFKAFSGNDKENVVNSSLVFVLALAGEPVRFGENDSFHSFWALDKQSADLFRENVLEFVAVLERNKKPVNEAELVSFAEKNSVKNARNIGVFMGVSKELGRNVFNEVGLVSWAEVKPKGVRDKAYLVLKKESQPKHFSEIARLINVTGFSSRKANIQTVHNELIKDPRFVLVGRGMYGLSEWGYKPGTVKEVLVDILKGSSGPVLKAELVAKVMDARMVKENTILLNLQDSKVFSKREDGTYILRKA